MISNDKLVMPATYFASSTVHCHCSYYENFEIQCTLRCYDLVETHSLLHKAVVCHGVLHISQQFPPLEILAEQGIDIQRC